MAAMNFPNTPTLGQIFDSPAGRSYKWNGYGWEPYVAGGGGGGSGSVTTLTAGVGIELTPNPILVSGTIAVAATGVLNAGSAAGSPTTVPVITYNAQGQLTTVTTTPISAAGIGAVTGVTAGNTNIVIGGTTTTPTVSLASTPVSSPGVAVGSASIVPIITYNAQGQLTAVTSTAILPAALGGGVANQIPYQTAPGVTSFIPVPTTPGTFLQYVSVDTFGWATPSGTGAVVSVGPGTGISITGTSTAPVVNIANTAVTGFGTPQGSATQVPQVTYNQQGQLVAVSLQTILPASLSGGLVNQILVQTGPGATGFIAAPGANNTYLFWNGTIFAWGTIGAGQVASVTAQFGLSNTGTATNPIIGIVNAITAGTAGSASQVPQITYTAQGLIQTVINQSIIAPTVAGGAALRILYQTGPSVTGFVVAPTVANTFLRYNGSGFDWTDSSVVGVASITAGAGIAITGTGADPIVSIQSIITAQNTVGNSTTIPVISFNAQGQLTVVGTAPIQVSNISGGTANRILVQTNVGATGFVDAPGTANTFLRWNGLTFDWAVASGAAGVTSISAGPGITILGGAATPQISVSDTGVTGALTPVGSATIVPIITYNTQGQLTVVDSAVIRPSSLSGGGPLQIPYQLALNQTAFIPAPTVSNTFLRYNGATFAWAAASGGVSTVTGSSGISTTGTTDIVVSMVDTLASGGVSTNTGALIPVLSYNARGQLLSVSTAAILPSNIGGGSQYALPYQQSNNQTTFTPAASVAGTFLQFTGTGFTWATAGVGGGTVTNVSGAVNGGISVVNQSTTPQISITNTITAGSAGSDTQSAQITYDLHGLILSANPITIVPLSVAGGALNQILYQTGLNATGFIPAPTTFGTVLRYVSLNTFDWVPPSSGSGTVTNVSGANGISVATGTTTPVVSITNSITAGTVGSATQVPQISYTAQGLVLSATSFPLVAPNIAGGAQYAIPVQTNINATGFIAVPGTAGTFLQFTGTGFAWAATSPGVQSVSGTSGITVTGTTTPVVSISNAVPGGAGTVGSASLIPIIVYTAQGLIQSQSSAPVIAPNLALGLQYQIPVQTAPNATGFIGVPGVGGTFLQFTGAGFTWTTPSSSPTMFIGEAPPASPVNGTTWWRSDIGAAFIFYADGTSSQWVPMTPQGAGVVNVVGGSGTGGVTSVSPGIGLTNTGTTTAPILNIGITNVTGFGTPQGSTTQVPQITYNAQGQLTVVALQTILPANLAGGSINGKQIVYQSTSNSTAFIVSPTTGAYLKYDGVNYVWSVPAGGVTSVSPGTGLANVGTAQAPILNIADTTVANATTPQGSASIVPVITYNAQGQLTTVTPTSIIAPAIANGAQYAIPVQTGNNTTGFVTVPVTVGTFLQFTGVGTGFTWAAAGTGSGTVTSVTATAGAGLAVTNPTSTPQVGMLDIAGLVGAGSTKGTAGAVAQITYNARGQLTVVSEVPIVAPNLAGGSARQIPYQTNLGITNFIVAAATPGTFLRYASLNTFDWATPPGGVSSVTGTAGITVTGTTTPVVSISNAVTGGPGAVGSPSVIPQITYTAEGLISAINGSTGVVATAFANGAQYNILVQTGPSATGFIPVPGTPLTFLQFTGTGFAWAIPSGTGSGTVTSVSPGTGIAIDNVATVNPSVRIRDTAVGVAATKGGAGAVAQITYNPQGQLTTVSEVPIIAPTLASPAGSTNKIPYQSAPNVTSLIDAPTKENTVLSYHTTGTAFRWQPAIATYVDVTAFGALGDDLPASASANTAAIQNAINSLSNGANGAKSGGTVFFPPGNYHVNGTIIVNREGVTLQGNTWRSASIIQDSPGIPTIRIDATYASIISLGIHYPATGGTFGGSAVVVSSTGGNQAFATLQSILIKNAYRAVEFEPNCNAVSISDFLFYDSRSAGFYLDGFVQNVVATQGSCITGAASTNHADGALKMFGNSQGCDFADIEFFGGVCALHMTEKGTDGPRPVSNNFTNCYFDSANAGPADLPLRGAFLYRAQLTQFVGCEFSNRPGVGMGVYNGVNTKFSNCLFVNCGTHGAEVGGGSVNTVFDACAFSSNSSTAANTYDGLHFLAGASDFLVQGCIADNNTAFSPPNSQRYGVYIEAGASNRYSITGNLLDNNGTGGSIFDGGTGSDKKVSGNIPGAGAGAITGIYDITTFGASTSSSDNAAAIQSAINAAFVAGGGTVTVPAGHWAVLSQIIVRPCVRLCGTAGARPVWPSAFAGGSVLDIRWGSGAGSSDDRTKTAVLLMAGGALEHMCFWYPTVDPALYPPAEWGATVGYLFVDTIAPFEASNPGWTEIIRCAFLLSYVGLDLRASKDRAGGGGTQRFTLLSNCWGAASSICVAIDGADDWCVFENCSFQSNLLLKTFGVWEGAAIYAAAFGTCVRIGSSDWTTLDTFQCFGYRYGVQIVGGPEYTATGPYRIYDCNWDGCQDGVVVSGAIAQIVDVSRNHFVPFNPFNGALGYCFSSAVSSGGAQTINSTMFIGNHMHGGGLGAVNFSNPSVAIGAALVSNNYMASNTGGLGAAFILRNIPYVNVAHNISRGSFSIAVDTTGSTNVVDQYNQTGA